MLTKAERWRGCYRIPPQVEPHRSADGLLRLLQSRSAVTPGFVCLVCGEGGRKADHIASALLCRCWDEQRAQLDEMIVRLDAQIAGTVAADPALATAEGAMRMRGTRNFGPGS